MYTRMSDKETLRKLAKEIRSSFEDKEKASLIIKEKLLTMEEVKKAETIVLYCSTSDEVHTDGLINDLLDTDKRLAMPVIRDGNMCFIEIDSLSELKNEGCFKIREPEYSKEKVINGEDIDLALFPGLAFDKEGNRLGHGKGYYDSYFSSYPKVMKIAPAYDCQIFENVPHDCHDVRVNRIVTQTDIINCIIRKMNEYYLLYNVDTHILNKTRDSYLREGFEIVFEDDKSLVVKRSTEENEEGEEKILKMIFQRFQRSSIDRPVSLDLSDLINRHLYRLVGNGFKSLKLHDPFIDELDHLITDIRLN